MIIVLLLWQLVITVAVCSILLRLRHAESELVMFSLLVQRQDRDKLCDKLLLQGVAVTANDVKHSDYIRCQTTRCNFQRIFNCKLLWREMLVGSWEVEGGTIPEEFETVKQCLLHRNLMLPYKFIGNTTIK